MCLCEPQCLAYFVAFYFHSTVSTLAVSLQPVSFTVKLQLTRLDPENQFHILHQSVSPCVVAAFLLNQEAVEFVFFTFAEIRPNSIVRLIFFCFV